MSFSSRSSLPKLAATLDVFLCFLLGLLALAAFFMTVTTGYHLITGKAPAVNGYEIKLTTSVPPLTLQSATGEPVEIEIESATAIIPLYQAAPSLQVVSIFGIFILFGLVACGLIQVRRFLGSIKTGQPFVAANAQRLRNLAWIIVAGGLVDPIIYGLTGALAHQSFPDFAFRLSLAGPFNAFFYGVIIFIIAEVFKIGVQMKEEQDLTV
ncbi:DUF2975 domain-containing protein [Synoicihabitans lomoniglobus]|uniref:DUF2975 domain-containing protein n=1 Tax=Synoicihabitans lomoniglobus TaxID=2909285 RepID=A0AAF0CHZ0_9BACT|nr:DUF2975 domain-containing protein [Opitutaceae bacterium LMO-M01]WED64802.1 DUF2975 domain-containing protein [Opitutaceae bacterium LMO-M01]